jgi:hypothetical protein
LIPKRCRKKGIVRMKSVSAICEIDRSADEKGRLAVEQFGTFA